MGFNKKFFTTGGIVASSPSGITGTDHFSPVTYTGNGSTQSISSLDFQPDFVWIKDRSTAYQHQAYDSVRGATQKILPSSTAAEVTDSTGLTSFDSNGFSISTNVGINTNGNNYVAWCWKAGGSAVSNTDGVTSGSVTAVTSTVSANQEAGFSICQFTTPSSGKPSWGHGLSQSPELIIVKQTDNTAPWFIYAPSILGQKELRFNTALATPYTPDFISVDSSKIDLGSSSFNISGSAEHINYNFHSVDGYQKVGVYSGTGTGTNAIATGFIPRFVMIKRTDSAGYWVIIDSLRENGDKWLYANTSDAEYDDANLYTEISATDGFIVYGSSGYVNASGTDNYIYLAIA